MKTKLVAIAAAAIAFAGCATPDTREGTVTATEWRVNLVRTGSVKVIETFKGNSQAIAWAACIAKLNSLTPNAYDCQALRFHAVVEADPVPPPVCTDPQPSDETRTMECPTGLEGSWSQTRVYVAAPYPTCWVPGEWIPATAPEGACEPPPPQGDKPTAANTGPTTDDLRPIGSTKITVAGTVLENFEASGTITVEAPDVTIRNCRISTGSSYGIRVNNSGTVIEDCEISQTDSSAIYGKGFTARRVHIHDCGSDAFKTQTDVLIEDSFIEKLGTKEGSHSDGMQMVNGGRVTLRGNNFDMGIQAQPGFSNSQVVLLKGDNGPIDSVTMENNWFNGAGYTIQVRTTDYGITPTNVILRNNRFGRDFRFGPWVLDGDVMNCGNVWDDTGKLVEGEGNTACPGKGQR